ncbi:glycerate kinase, partial [Cellulosimicrobium sp. CUA-896]|uniref:glycerate kinase n=1 Tax=Cellulosimicrobium sp. CUA-896 TaxID=1517881 RepID=UPI001650FA34
MATVELARSGPAFLDALGEAAPELLAGVVPGDGGVEVPVVLRRDPRTATVYADASQVPAVGDQDQDGTEDGTADGTADGTEGRTTGAGPRSSAPRPSVPRSSAALGHLLALSADAAHAPDGRPGRVVLATGGARSHDAGWGLLRALARHATPGPDATPDPDADPGATATDVLRHARAALRGTTLVAAVASSTPLLGLHGASAALAARGVDDAVAQGLERCLGAVAHAVAGAVGTLDRDGRGPVAGRDLLADASPRRSRRSGARAAAAVRRSPRGARGRLVPAVREVADAVGLDTRLAAADLVVVADELGARELGRARAGRSGCDA